MEIKNNVSLKDYSTYRTGGKADFLCECGSREEILKALNYAKAKDMDWLVIGGGSNILFGDSGYRGLVIINKIEGVEISNNLVTVGAGLLMSKFITGISLEGLTGLEFMAGIPGTVGGAVIGNAGAWGHEISEKIEKIVVIEGNEEIKEIKLKDINFSYRRSSLSDTDYTVVSVTFRLNKGKPDVIKEKMREYIKKKADSQPKGLSCGSYFKNPKTKPAGLLIEELGFKGKRVGGAQVSKDHANFIINTGDASSSDIYRLAQMIKKKVKTEFGIILLEEVKYVGIF